MVEDNTASNLGAGEGVFASKVGVDLRFRGLVQGDNVTLTSDATGITIAAADGDAIHDNVAGEIAAITQKAVVTNADRILIEDSADTNNKKSISPADLNLLRIGQVPVTDAVATNGWNLSTGSLQFNLASSVTSWTLNVSANNVANDARIASVLINNQTSGMVPVTLGGSITFESGLTSSFNVPVGITRLVGFANAGQIYLGAASISAVGSRGISSQAIANNATFTVEMSGSAVTTLNVADTATAIGLAVNGAVAGMERKNKIIIDNSANTVALSVTFDDQSGAITFRRAVNEFPGTYPTMNVGIGAIWEIEFESESATTILLDFIEIEE